MLILLSLPATKSEIEKASSHYPNYVKITIDIEKEMLMIGGEYHFDAEQELLKNGSKQENIWGGGLDLITKELNTIAMINIRTKFNPHQEIQDNTIKKKFFSIAYKFLKNYAKKPALLS